jgi:hypothetical protein
MDSTGALQVKDFDEWLAAQSLELSNDEIRKLWERYPNLDGFDERRADLIGQNGNGGEHYEQ